VPHLAAHSANGCWLPSFSRPQVKLAEVVLADSRLLLLLAVAGLEVRVEVASVRRRPRKAHPIRRLYACSIASGARDTAQSIKSWLARWIAKPLKLSAIAEQDGHPAV